MNTRRTMTLYLTDAEMAVLTELSGRKELTKTAVIRQALRLYQMVEARLERGDKLFIEGRRAKAELLVL